VRNVELPVGGQRERVSWDDCPLSYRIEDIGRDLFGLHDVEVLL
jgi:hypothetical protein